MKLDRKIFVQVLLFLTVAIIISQNVLATNVSIEKIKTVIQEKEFAEFLIWIENTGNVTKEYSLDFGIQPQWSIISQPFYTLTLEPGEKGSFHVYVKAKSEIPADHYAIPFKVKSGDEEIPGSIYITYGEVESDGEGYKPTVKMAVSLEPDYSIDPREPFRFKILLNNYNVLNLSNLRIIVLGAGLNIQKNVSLGPLETRKTYFIDAKLDPQIEPGPKKIMIALDKDRKIIASVDDIEINVLAYNNTIINTSETKKHLIVSKKTTILNKGNHKINFVYNKETNYFKNLFTKTEPKAYLIKEDGQLYFGWNIELLPGEQTEIVVTENYLSLIIIILLIALTLLTYYLFRSPIVCEKKVEIVKSDEETKVTTKIIVKNRSSKRIKDVVIKELVPPILNVKIIKQIGILEPSRIIKHEKKGTLLEWKIDYLEPLEERIIIYRSATKLSIIGEILLKSTLVKYKIGNRERVTKSNSVITNI